MLQVSDEQVEIKAPRLLTQVRHLMMCRLQYAEYRQTFPGRNRFRHRYTMKGAFLQRNEGSISRNLRNNQCFRIACINLERSKA